MARGDAEYQALTLALETTNPGCRDDPRYLLDETELEPTDIPEMKRTCRNCATSDACALYGAAAKPPAGMWAGRHYPPSQRRTRKEARDGQAA